MQLRSTPMRRRQCVGIMKAGSNAAGPRNIFLPAKPKRKALILMVSVRLSRIARSSLAPDVSPSASDFVGMRIITKSKEYLGSPDTRSTAILCSLSVQMGTLFGIKIPSSECDDNRTWDQWKLYRLSGEVSKEIMKLNDIVNGDQLLLDCGEHWAYALGNEDTLKGLPFRKWVKVEFTPLLHCDVNAGASGNKGPVGKPPQEAKKNAESIANDSRHRYVGSSGSGEENINEVIVLSSDDESDCSSVEDVTDKFRACRDEERRKMKANAEEID